MNFKYVTHYTTWIVTQQDSHDSPDQFKKKIKTLKTFDPCFQNNFYFITDRRLRRKNCIKISSAYNKVIDSVFQRNFGHLKNFILSILADEKIFTR